MLTKVTLDRFRGFRSLTVDARQITAIVGRNSSGKTSVLHAIRMALEGLAIGLEEGAPHLDSDLWITVFEGLVWDHARLHPVDDWTELFTDKEVGEGIAMTIGLGFEESDVIQALGVTLSYARNDQLRLRVRVRSDRAAEEAAELPKKSKFRSVRLSEVLRRSAPKAVFVPAFYGVTNGEEFRTSAVVSRLLGGGDQSRIVRNFIARLNSDAFNRLSDFLRYSIGATLVRRTTAQDADDVRHLAVYFQDTNGELELGSAGAGLVNMIALYAIMYHFRSDRRQGELGSRPVVYLLDEPEAHLHPKLQGDIGEALAALAVEFGAQLVIATHSIEMINRLGQRRDALLLAVDRASSRAVELASEAALVRELSAWCDLTPFTSLNFLASRRILFHEGPSDAEILTGCAAIYFRNRPADLAAFKRWTLVSLGGVGNVKAQGVLKAVLTPSLFPTLDAREPVRAICVLDRDTERQGGFRQINELTRGHFEAYELVWPRYSIESMFIEPARLAAWIAAVLMPGAVARDELERYVSEAIKAANQDQKLLDDAEKNLQLAKIRIDQMKLADAIDAAKAQARAEPEIWQKGRDRARVVLREVRERLTTNSLKNQLRGSITSLIDAASVDKLGDPEVLIPAEIGELLEHMVAPSGGRSA
ncbi:AAA family ATPase [Sorangium sp. So ce1335]|uniref:AAA family ATPase n=1 Tax=Sorangium sp. So ce1335 TaxID=3133335 RepID=UPI003F615F9D